MNAIVDRYDQDAAEYARYWAPVLEHAGRRMLDFVDDYVAWVLRRDESVRILEVGIGTGHLLPAVLERWPRAGIVATDAAPAMVDLARRRLLEATPGLAGRVEFVAAPADSLRLPDASVDLVMSTFVLQLVPDRLVALREALRVLKPAGRVAYLTWLDRDARQPFLPGEEFDEAVLDLDIDEPEGADEPHAGDVRSGRTATNELRRAGFTNASAREETLEYEWTLDSYLDYKLNYDETLLLSVLEETQRAELERNARERLSRLKPADFRWHAPIVFARADKPA